MSKLISIKSNKETGGKISLETKKLVRQEKNIDLPKWIWEMSPYINFYVFYNDKNFIEILNIKEEKIDNKGNKIQTVEKGYRNASMISPKIIPKMLDEVILELSKFEKEYKQHITKFITNYDIKSEIFLLPCLLLTTSSNELNNTNEGDVNFNLPDVSMFEMQYKNSLKGTVNNQYCYTIYTGRFIKKIFDLFKVNSSYTNINTLEGVFYNNNLSQNIIKKLNDYKIKRLLEKGYILVEKGKTIVKMKQNILGKTNKQGHTIFEEFKNFTLYFLLSDIEDLIVEGKINYLEGKNLKNVLKEYFNTKNRKYKKQIISNQGHSRIINKILTVDTLLKKGKSKTKKMNILFSDEELNLKDITNKHFNTEILNGVDKIILANHFAHMSYLLESLIIIGKGINWRFWFPGQGKKKNNKTIKVFGIPIVNKEYKEENETLLKKIEKNIPRHNLDFNEDILESEESKEENNENNENIITNLEENNKNIINNQNNLQENEDRSLTEEKSQGEFSNIEETNENSLNQSEENENKFF
jgi:hypothetical protein